MEKTIGQLQALLPLLVLRPRFSRFAFLSPSSGPPPPLSPSLCSALAFRASLPFSLLTPAPLAKFVKKLCLKYSDKTKYEAIKSEVNKLNRNFSKDTQRLKLLFPGTALSFDFLKNCFEFLGNISPINLLIFRTRDAFDRCGKKTYFSAKEP